MLQVPCTGPESTSSAPAIRHAHICLCVCVSEGKGQRVFLLKLNSYDSQAFQLFNANSDLSLHLKNEPGAKNVLSFCVRVAAGACGSSAERSGGKAAQLHHPHPTMAAEVPASGYIHFFLLWEKKKKKGLTVCSPSFLWLLERQCKVLLVHATWSLTLIFYKLNPNKPTNMKIACFKRSQLKASPAFLKVSYLLHVLHLNSVTSVLPALCL